MSGSTPETKLHLSLGQLTLEYEGSEAFLVAELPRLLQAAFDLVADAKALDGRPDDEAGSGDTGGDIDATTGTIAAQLDVKTGPDLVRAAAAKICLADGNSTFTRDRLVGEMRSAPSYYKESYVKNLSSSLTRLVRKGVLRETKKDTYALSADAADELKKKLAT